MDSELQRIAAKLSELSQLEPGLGYRAYHSKLKEHADFASISLKKVENAKLFVSFSIFQCSNLSNLSTQQCNMLIPFTSIRIL